MGSNDYVERYSGRLLVGFIVLATFGVLAAIYGSPWRDLFMVSTGLIAYPIYRWYREFLS